MNYRKKMNWVCPTLQYELNPPPQDFLNSECLEFSVDSKVRNYRLYMECIDIVENERIRT